MMLISSLILTHLVIMTLITSTPLALCLLLILMSFSVVSMLFNISTLMALLGFIIYVGGVMILFLYVGSIDPNTTLINNEMFRLFTYLTPTLLIMCLYFSTKFNLWTPSLDFNFSFNIFYSSTGSVVLLFSAILLLIGLFFAVSLCISQVIYPMRSYKYLS